MPVGFILGVASQDGSYLTQFLLDKGYKVIGTVRGEGENTVYIDSIKSRIVLESVDLEHPGVLSELLQKYQPDEFYHLAALTVPSSSWEQSYKTGLVTGLGPVASLEAIRKTSSHTRFFQASTREIFGSPEIDYADENTPVNPTNPYAVAKAYAHFMVKTYRNSGLYAVNGILFNHESPRRPLSFVARKITLAAAAISKNISNIPQDPSGIPILNPDGKLHLWDTGTLRDRGFAGDYVEAMWLMLQQEKPDDYVVATGELHSIAETCEAAFSFVGLDWEKFVVVDGSPSGNQGTPGLRGNAEKLKKLTGWKPKMGFRELIEMMVKSDLMFLDQPTS